jgi:hypothetical protein
MKATPPLHLAEPSTLDLIRGFIFGSVAISFVIGLYLAPAIVALARRHHNRGAIFVLNLLLGWTLVGWVVALVWAVSQPHQVTLAGTEGAGRLPCPYCAEPIMRAATVCRFCNRALEPGWDQPRRLSR